MFLTAVVDCHLSYLRLISVDDHLRTLPRIENLDELKGYPTLQALKVAFENEIDLNVSSPQDLPRMPDLEKVMTDTDVEIFNWVLQAEEVATATANREVEPMSKEIAEEDQALEPVHQDNADSDDEIVKVKAITLEDRIQARNEGLSEMPDQEWQNPSYEAEAGDQQESFVGWDLIPDDKRPPGVEASDPVIEEERELDISEPETVASEEIVEEEAVHHVEEGEVEAIEEDDDDLAVISGIASFGLVGGESTTARGDPEPMDIG